MLSNKAHAVLSATRCLALSFAAATAAVGVAAAPAYAAPLNVTLLGTGSPSPSNVRFSQSILVEAGKEKLLFDLGRGVTIRLAQLNIPIRDITASFITHLHSDHITGLPDFWMTGWLPTPYASRTKPMVIYGPKGTVAMTKGLTTAFSENTRIRMADEKLPASGIAFDAHDIKPGVVYNHDGVKVSAFESHHGDLIKPNYGYTIEYDGKKVVISSDTTYDERVAKQGKGADLLIHEVADIDPELIKTYPRYKEIAAHHTSPEEAGRIFSMAKPKLAVYTHIIVTKAKKTMNNAPTEVVERTRTTYKGPLAVGEDLMHFEINDDGIKVFNAKKEPVKIEGL